MIDLNAISLEQALIDFEVANSRVIDLTKRLTQMSEEVLSLRCEVENHKTKLALHRVSNSLSIAATIDKSQDVLKQIRKSRVLRITLLFAPRLRKALEE